MRRVAFLLLGMTLLGEHLAGAESRGLGALRITTEPASALVSIGTTGVGRGPTVFRQLPEGSYEVSVRQVGFAPKTESAKVVKGEITRLHVRLRQEGPDVERGRTHRVVVKQDTETLGIYTSLADALRAAPEGARIELGPATYREAVVVEKSVMLVGLGAREEAALSPKTGCAVEVLAGEVLLQNVSLVGGDGAGMALKVRGGKVRVDRCRLTAPQGWAALVSGSELELRDTLVEASSRGGLRLERGAVAELVDSEVADSDGVGVAVLQGAVCRAENTTVRDHAENGVLVEGRASLERCDVAFNRRAGIEVREHGVLELSDCKVFEGLAGGVWVYGAARATLSESRFVGNGIAHVEVGPGGRAEASACSFERGEEVGVLLRAPGYAELTNCTFKGNALAHVEARGEGGTARLADCRLERGFDVGILVHDHAQLELADCVVTDTELPGVEVENGRVSLQGCDIHGGYQAGLLVESGGEARVAESRLVRNGSNGIEVREGGRVEVLASTVASNHYAGVRAHLGGVGRVEGSILVDNGRGAFLWKSGGRIEARDNKLH